MTRVVVDTNIYISAVMFGGLPGSVLDLGLLRAFALITSPPLLDELEDKLRVKFGVSAGDAAAIRAKLENAADVVNPQLTLDVVKDDPDDNRVLECAVAGGADTIVSGDRHLLQLKAHAGIPILTARQFLEALAPSSGEPSPQSDC
jgi:putative PIN family toxin of toxin-antitoxin system